MGVATYCYVYHMPPEVRLQRFLFNDGISIVEEHERITAFFSEAFSAICPFQSQLIDLKSTQTATVLRFKGFYSNGAVFSCRVNEKECDISSCYLKPEVTNKDAVRYFDDLREIGKTCTLCPRSSLHRLSELGSKIETVVTRSLDEELALTDDQKKLDNILVAEIQKMRLSRGHWKRFGVNRSPSDLSSLSASDAWKTVSANSLTLDEVCDGIHHIAGVVSKQLVGKSDSPSLIACDMGWSLSNGSRFMVQDLLNGAFDQLFLVLADAASDSSFLVHLNDVHFAEESGLKWFEALLAILKSRDDPLVVVRRASLQSFMAEMISKTLLLLESRGEDDFAPAVQEIANWKTTVTEFSPCQCNFCGREGQDLLRCSKCKKATYCNVDCQRGNWGTHKKTCK
eukprot:TRINITY_DN15603_c0_g1_i1.p1 TRINITY_DN15603_c0_g1~~TRINITY_DN15603_c0_g1_i1.p1  ORF type:complete len:413 (-),score=39.72 TRINITY_DN15603_c0_g1_i1:618-1811(-)